MQPPLIAMAKTLLFWIGLVVLGVLLWQFVQRSGSEEEMEWDFSEFIQELEQSNVREVEIVGSEVKGKTKDNTPLHDRRSRLR